MKKFKGVMKTSKYFKGLICDILVSILLTTIFVLLLILISR